MVAAGVVVAVAAAGCTFVVARRLELGECLVEKSRGLLLASFGERVGSVLLHQAAFETVEFQNFRDEIAREWQ